MTPIDFSTVLTQLNGKPILLGAEDDAPPMTLANACIMALTNPVIGDDQDAGDAKFARFQLAQRIHDAVEKQEPLALKAEDVAALKDRIGRAWPVMVVGRAWPLLDPQA